MMAALSANNAAARDAAVLVVDDEPLLLGELADGLRRRGFTVFTAGSALEALDLLAGTRLIGVVLTDLIMPGMDGLAMAEQIRNASAALGTPEVILLSAAATAADADRAGRAGAFAVLAKPVRLRELVVTVGNAMTRWTERTTEGAS